MNHNIGAMRSVGVCSLVGSESFSPNDQQLSWAELRNTLLLRQNAAEHMQPADASCRHRPHSTCGSQGQNGPFALEGLLEPRDRMISVLMAVQSIMTEHTQIPRLHGTSAL